MGISAGCGGFKHLLPPMNPQLLDKKMPMLRRQIAAVVFSICLILGSLLPISPAFAAGPDVGLTSFYRDAQGQENKVGVLNNLGYNVAVPLNVNQLKDLGDGSFTEADLDFSTAIPTIPETDRRISFQAPLGSGASSRLYAVVAGIPDPGSCPIAVKQTKIAFFDNQKAADAAAAQIANDGFLVYVTTNSDIQKDAMKKIAELNCKPDGAGIIVNGKTKLVSVDFTNIWPLLPDALQQAAKASAFVYQPAGGSDSIYLVNARKRNS